MTNGIRNWIVGLEKGFFFRGMYYLALNDECHPLLSVRMNLRFDSRSADLFFRTRGNNNDEDRIYLILLYG